MTSTPSALLQALLTLSIILSTIPTLAIASDKHSTVDKTLIIGVEDLSYYPMYGRHQGQTKPYFNRVIEQFSHHSGYRFKIQLLPVKRLKAFLASNQVDFIFPSNKRWKKKLYVKDMARSAPVIYTNVLSLVTDSNKTMTVNNVHYFGALLGFTPTYWQNVLNIGKVKRLEFADTRNMVSALLQGRVDVVDIPSSVARQQLSQLNAKDKVETGVNLPSMRIGFSLATVHHKDILAQFDEFMKNNTDKLTKLKHSMGVYEFSEPVDDQETIEKKMGIYDPSLR